MSKEMPFSSSVDMSGDLSRGKGYSGQVSHRAEVGEPMGTRNYDPNRHHQHEGEGVNSSPLKCAIVLGTINDAGATEYRIGRLSHKALSVGLCTPLFPDKKSSRLILRSDVVADCFGESDIYTERNAAIHNAQHKFRDNNGIKVIRLPCGFPG